MPFLFYILQQQMRSAGISARAVERGRLLCGNTQFLSWCIWFDTAAAVAERHAEALIKAQRDVHPYDDTQMLVPKLQAMLFGNSFSRASQIALEISV